MSRAAKVIAACFDGLPERAILEQLVRSPGAAYSLEFDDDRIALMRHVAAQRPAVVLFPPQDARALLSAPLIARLRHDAPDVGAAVLARVGAPGLGVMQALRAGAMLLQWAEPADLAATLSSFVGVGVGEHPDHLVVRALVSDFAPESCVRVLRLCADQAQQRLNVAEVAAALRTSRRTLTRRMRENHWPTPAEVIRWGRLLRASVVQWKNVSSGAALANAAGFTSARAMEAAARHALPGELPCATAFTPLHVTTALRRRLDVLGRDVR